MKTTYFWVFLFVTSTFTFLNGQSQSLTWSSVAKASSSSSFKLIQKNGNTKSIQDLLTPQGTVRLEKRSNAPAVYQIDLGRAVKNVHLPLRSYYNICRGNCAENTRTVLRISGLRGNNKQVLPVFTYTSLDQAHLQVEQEQITIFRAGKNEIDIAFPEAIRSIEIEILTNQDDPNFYSFVEFGDITWVEPTMLSNPPLQGKDCDQWNIVFALDASASVDKSERLQINNSLIDLFTTWQEQSFGKEINLTLIDYNSSSVIRLPATRLSMENLSEEGIIRQTLKEFVDQKPAAPTNWVSALKSIHEIVPPNSVLFFLSDGVPNYKGEKDQAFTHSINEIVELSTQLKATGCHIYGIGFGDLNKESTAVWMAYLSDGENAKTITEGEAIDFNELDYVSEASLASSFAIFHSFPFHCEKEELTFSARIEAFPNPARETLNITFDLEQKQKNYSTLQIEIINALGQILHQSSIVDNQSITVDTRNYPSGVYTVLLKKSSQIISSIKVSLLQ